MARVDFPNATEITAHATTDGLADWHSTHRAALTGEAQDARPPIKPHKVYVMAANWIAEQIESGRWGVGSRLPAERELSEMLQISRTSVRQALMALESIGVLRSKRGAGHFVLQLPGSAAKVDAVSSLMQEGDPQEILEARRAFEPQVARLAAIYRDVDDIQFLMAAQQRMIENEAPSNFDAYLVADFEFHLLLACATHNSVLIDMEKVILQRMRAPAWRTATQLILPHNFASNRNEHAAILKAVVDANPREAQEQMVKHLKHHARNIRNISAFQDE